MRIDFIIHQWIQDFSFLVNIDFCRFFLFFNTINVFLIKHFNFIILLLIFYFSIFSYVTINCYISISTEWFWEIKESTKESIFFKESAKYEVCSRREAKFCSLWCSLWRFGPLFGRLFGALFGAMGLSFALSLFFYFCLKSLLRLQWCIRV